MKKSKYSDAQIMAILKQAENGVPVPDLCREHGMSSASFYKWRSKYGGMDASLMARMKELDEENKRLKKMYAEKSMQNDLPVSLWFAVHFPSAKRATGISQSSAMRMS